MKIEVLKYDPDRDYQRLYDIIKSEGEEWQEYLLPKYKLALEKSITYVAYANNKLCGYSRSANDCDLFIWVIDLLVDKEFRGHSIGRELMECLCDKFPDMDTYVMSDVDDYYEKLCYKREGSIFKVKKILPAGNKV